MKRIPTIRLAGLSLVLVACGPETPTEPPAATSFVVINEVSASGDDRIELVNAGSGAVDLAGWTLYDEDRTPSKSFAFSGATILEPGERLLMRKGEEHAFGLGASDAVFLFDETGVLVDSVDWVEPQAQQSLARIPDGTGFFAPCSLHTFGSSNVVSCNATILEPLWTVGGQRGSEPGTHFDVPNELTFDRNGNLWAGDVENFRLQVYDPSGVFITTVGEKGDDPGQFAQGSSWKAGPEGMRVDTDNRVFVVDPGGRRINVYDGDTFEFVREIGSEHFEVPTGLEMDAAGDLYVADQGSNQVHQFTHDGDYVRTFQDEWNGSWILQKVETLSLDESTDRLFATSENVSKVEVFRLSSGEYLGKSLLDVQVGEIPEPGRMLDDIEGLYVDIVNRHLVACDEDNGRFLFHDLDAGDALYDPSENFAFLGTFGRRGGGLGHYKSPDGVIVWADGNRLAVADQGNFRIQVFMLSEVHDALGL